MSFQNLKLADVLPQADRPVVTIRDEEAVEKALKLLAKENISSAPVLDAEHKCIGLIDVLDCVKFALDLYFETTKELEASEWKNYAVSLCFGLQKVKNIANTSKRNPYRPMKKDVSLREVLQEFARGVHRIPVVDDNGKIVQMFSQLDCILYLSKNFRDFFTNSDFSKKSIRELRLGQLPDKDDNLILFSVESTDLAINAYRLMHEAGISAVGIEKDGKIIGNLSASDLKGFCEEEFAHLGDPVSEFHNFARVKASKSTELISCSSNTSFAEVLDIIQRERVHRLYVIDRDECNGVITLTDIFKKVLQLADHHHQQQQLQKQQLQQQQQSLQQEAKSN